MKTNYPESARRMLDATMRSEAQVMTQWADVQPLTSWVTEWENAAVPDVQQMQYHLDRRLRRLTNKGLLSPLGSPYGGIKLRQSVNNTWLLFLYSQFDVEGIMAAILNGGLEDESGVI